MIYATLADLASRYSLRDLAQAAAPDAADVDEALLKATLAGGARTTYTAAQRADADAAMARLQQALDDAHAEVNGWIAGRYPDLSMSPAALLPYTLDIAVYRLFRPADSEDPHMVRYKSAIAWLKEVARGMIDLPSPTPDPDTSAGVTVTAPDQVFDADSLRGYSDRYGYGGPGGYGRW